MIRPLKPEELIEIFPLLYEAWEEQSATRQAFNSQYLELGLHYALTTCEDFIVLTTDEYDCILIAHTAPSLLFPDIEGYEDLLYIRKDKRGTTRFYKLVNEFEKFSRRRGAIKTRVGVGTGIMDAQVAELYKRMGYSPSYTGFVKEINQCVVVEDAELS